MSKMLDSVKETRSAVKTRRVTNFMGGNSFELNALDTLKMVTASSIFGEPSYYRNGEFDEAKITDAVYNVDACMAALSVLDDSKFKGKKTSEIMEMVIDEALSEDFGAVLDWAVTLRKDYLMRLNPQVIMVRAAQHPGRVAFNEANPNKFRKVESLVMSRADEPASQLTYYLYKNKNKKNLPNILKRSWAEKLSGLNAYQVSKYKNAGLGMIDVVRISHANSPVLNELMKTGTVEVKEEDMTWENLRSAGKSWKEILGTIKLGHMALLRNLRNIFTETNDRDLAEKVLEDLKAGVKEGKQFPFRYYSAYRAVENDSKVNFKPLILDALEECLDISLDNMPKLRGKTITLTDNSGSAWGTIPTEYGSVTVAEIDNLSAVITAMRSDEGYVGVFGDRLEIVPIKKRDGVLSQMKNLNRIGRGIGGGTENGIWLFFDKAIKNAEHWDNIFVYSDMQAGHGGLYGINSYEYRDYSCSGSRGWGGDRYIDVMKLLTKYRSTVNSKVNMFSVQTAGYTNVVIPEYAYRSNVMYGWTGKEVIFADAMINFWNQKESAKLPRQ